MDLKERKGWGEGREREGRERGTRRREEERTGKGSRTGWRSYKRREKRRNTKYSQTNRGETATGKWAETNRLRKIEKGNNKRCWRYPSITRKKRQLDIDFLFLFFCDEKIRFAKRKKVDDIEETWNDNPRYIFFRLNRGTETKYCFRVRVVFVYADDFHIILYMLPICQSCSTFSLSTKPTYIFFQRPCV